MKIRNLLPPRELRLPEPSQAEETVLELVETARHSLLPEVSEYALDHAVVWALPLVEWRGRAVWDPFNAGVEINPQGPFSFRRYLGAWKYPQAPWPECLLFFSPHANCSVYHWLCESLPRLLLLAERHGWDCPALLPEADAPILGFQMRSLEWIGFRGPVCHTRLDRGLRVRKLITCDMAAPIGLHRPKLTKEIRRRLRAEFGAADANSADRIYISRSMAGCRRTANEEEVAKVFCEFGFRIVHLETMPPDDQVRASLNARVIAGNHGGGLSCMLYAPPSCVILEIRAETDSHSHCYYTLAHALGLEYHILPVRTAQPDRGKDTDYYVEPERLREKLAGMLLN